MKDHQLIDGSHFAELLDSIKHENVDANDIDTDAIEKLGIEGTKKEISETIPAFLIRTNLFHVEKNLLVPFLIQGNWENYPKAWILKGDNSDFHVPFQGIISFFCNISGKKTWICHPSDGSEVEKIYFYTGLFTHKPSVGRYKKNSCQEIMEKYRSKNQVLPTDLVKNVQFFNVLRHHDFIVNEELEGLSYEDIFKQKVSIYLDSIKDARLNDCTKLSKLLLHSDSKRDLQITTMLLMINNMQKQSLFYNNPVVIDKHKFIMEKEKNIRKRSYKWVPDFTPINTITRINRVALENVLKHYSKLSSNYFFEYYKRETLDVNRKRIKQHFIILSSSIDSIGLLLRNDYMTLLNKLSYNEEGKYKFENHLRFLKNKINNNSEISMKELYKIEDNNHTIDIINLNPNEDKLRKICDTKITSCKSNMYIISKTSVRQEEIKKKAVEILNKQAIFADSQGAFYYPDFRILMCDIFSLSFKEFDDIFATILSKDRSFKMRFWFFVSFGSNIKVSKYLSLVISKPFDYVSLRY